jgi:hypothetical protein
LLDAISWPQWLRDVRLPPTTGRGEPDYMKNYEYDPTPDNAGVDSFMEVKDSQSNRAIIHVRMQSQYEPDLGRTLWRDCEKVRRQHKLPVSTVVILLHEGADGPDITGEYLPRRRTPAGSQPFRYSVARAWEKQPEEMLSGGLGTLPLAPMSDVDEAQLPAVIARMQEIIEEQAKPEDAAKLWLSTYFFMGLRYPADLIHSLLEKVMPLVRSTGNYQNVQAHGYVQGVSQGMVQGPLLAARQLIRAQGEKRFGPLDRATAADLDAIADLDRLEAICERLLDAADWRELMLVVRGQLTLVDCC